MGAEDFAIDVNGVVTLERELNYALKSVYQLKAIATNSIGEREVEIGIRVHSVPELQDLSAEVKSMAPEGTLIGKIDMWVDDETTLTDIALIGEGAENFTLGINGEIYVDAGAELHHFVTPRFDLSAIATNHYGSSKEAQVTIRVSALMVSVDIPGYAMDVVLSTRRI